MFLFMVTYEISEIQVNYFPIMLVDFKLDNSRKSFELVLEQWEQNQIEMLEEVKVILLNRSNKVLGIYSLAKGGITSCVVDVRIILSVALKTLATGIILVHNHPSGNLKPSQDDLKVTKKLKESCSLLDITLLDHLIITKDDYYSFADEGIL
jgi:DNA repair protein RadC